MIGRARRYDAIVIGSGISGGWAAKELCERGLDTLVLEAGPAIEPARDYVEHLQPWDLRFRGRGDPRTLERDQFIQRNCNACDEWSGKFFVNDRENPYSFDDDKPFHWIRGRHVGGRSIMWGRQVYRWSDLDFEANAREGIAVDWPIRYADVAPWYDYVERFIGVSGQAEGLPQLPDGQFLPPMQMTCPERHLRERLRQHWNGERVLTIGRVAILTQGHNGRAACHYCGPCWRGCITHSYFSSVGSTLPAAARTGRLTLRPNSVAERVLYDPNKDRATGVHVIDAQTRQSLEFEGRVIFMCASALESARLLLNSKSARFSTGLGNSSGQLGRNLMDHTFGAGARASMPGMEDRTSYGHRPNGIYIPRFRNVSSKHPDFLRGYGFQGSALRNLLDPPALGYGADFKQALLRRDLGPWKFNLTGFAECLPRADNFIELHRTLVDKWGVPALNVHCTFGPNERALLSDAQTTAAEILDAAGAKDIETYDDDCPPGLCIHEMGTARMGRDPKSSVLNAHNQLWDAKNVFVTDGACMTSSGNQNPSLTYMALTARAAEYAVEAMKRSEI